MRHFFVQNKSNMEADLDGSSVLLPAVPGHFYLYILYGLLVMDARLKGY